MGATDRQRGEKKIIQNKRITEEKRRRRLDERRTEDGRKSEKTAKKFEPEKGRRLEIWRSENDKKRYTGIHPFAYLSAVFGYEIRGLHAVYSSAVLPFASFLKFPDFVVFLKFSVLLAFSPSFLRFILSSRTLVFQNLGRCSLVFAFFSPSFVFFTFFSFFFLHSSTYFYAHLCSLIITLCPCYNTILTDFWVTVVILHEDRISSLRNVRKFSQFMQVSRSLKL